MASEADVAEVSAKAAASNVEVAQAALEADLEDDLSAQEQAAIRIQAITRGKQHRQKAQEKKEGKR